MRDFVNPNVDNKRVCYIGFKNGVFVAVTTRNTSLDYFETGYSYDGINWTFSKISSNDYINCVKYVNERFVICCNASIHVSTDGINWSKYDFSERIKSNSDICYGNGKYVLTEMNGRNIYYSTDLLNQKSILRISSFDNDDLQKIEFINGMYVAVGENIFDSSRRFLVYSTDARNWTEIRYDNNPLSAVCAVQ